MHQRPKKQYMQVSPGKLSIFNKVIRSNTSLLFSAMVWWTWGPICLRPPIPASESNMSEDQGEEEEEEERESEKASNLRLLLVTGTALKQMRWENPNKITSRWRRVLLAIADRTCSEQEQASLCEWMLGLKKGSSAQFIQGITLRDFYLDLNCFVLWGKQL